MKNKSALIAEYLKEGKTFKQIQVALRKSKFTIFVP
jgi:hypothetical protein